MASPAEHDMVEQGAFSLPLDTLRRVFSSLDCASLFQCSCVSHAWNALASEDVVWQKQLATELYRPEMLRHYSLLVHTNATQNIPLKKPLVAAEAAEEVVCNKGGCPHVFSALKEVFANCMALPVCQHQVLLARFHTVLRSLHAWRLMIKLKPAVDNVSVEQCGSVQQPATARGAVVANTCDRNLQSCVSADGSNHATSSNCCSSNPAHSDCAVENPKPLVGYPAPLNSNEFVSGAAAGWCCGCVQVQLQEQSCWLRLVLPPELKTDVFLNGAAAGFGGLVATVQALGPCGWFNVATCDPFTLESNDIDILLQSHKTGFYAWDQSEEDGPAKEGNLEPMPWDMNLNNWQQVLQQHQRQQQQQQEGSATQPQGSPQWQQGASGAPTNTTQSGTQQQQQRRQPDLRMLVYIHYEQLLQSVTWQLPQTLPVAKPPVFSSMAAVGRHLTTGPAAAAALWLHLDVCQLHGGFRLGSCVAPLGLVRMGPQKVVFEAKSDSVLLALYDPDSNKNSSCSRACNVQQQQQQSDDQHSRVQHITDKTCRLLLLGEQHVGGSSKGVQGSEGLLIESAADALGKLMDRDEVMVDFSLFDGKGHLLMGRAGVEVWSKECTSYHTPQQLPHPHAAYQQAQQGNNPQQQQQQQQQDVAAAAAGPLPAGPIVHTRQLHMLHFLVDSVDSQLWDNSITVDTAAAPAGLCLPLVSLALTWPALRGLFMKPAGKQPQRTAGSEVSGECSVDDVCAVGEAMMAMMA